jgi:chloramphenicol-sensitive protein RarD
VARLDAQSEVASPGSGRPLAAAASCYAIWGLVPLVFQALGHMGASPWEILAQRTVWGAPAALAMVLWARQGGAARRLLTDPRTLAWLALSALLIGLNWSAFIWAVNRGHVLETSLGYYILPLINMAVGAAVFGERVDRTGVLAIALAAAGVVLQTVALGQLPVVSIFLALTFGGYGVVRKCVKVEAQTGLLVECLMLAAPGLSFILWLQGQGLGHFGEGPAMTAGLIACGPLTAIPLVLFGWAARRLPLSAMGFLQFISPTLTFAIGVAQGEPFSPLRAVSFGFIWAGVAAFGYAAWRHSRAALAAAAQTALDREAA